MGYLSMRKKFMAIHRPPYTCFFCETEIDDLTGNGAWSLNTHHLDEDHSNDDPSNLVAVHKSCHTHHHHYGRKSSPEHRARISRALMGNENAAKTSANRAGRLPRRRDID